MRSVRRASHSDFELESRVLLSRQYSDVVVTQRWFGSSRGCHNLSTTQLTMKAHLVTLATSYGSCAFLPACRTLSLMSSSQAATKSILASSGVSTTALRALLPSSASVLHACGRIAPASSMVLFLAPLPTLLMVARQKSTQNLPLLPYSSMVCSSILWVAYGVLKQDPRIWSGNAVGLVMGLLYLATFVRYHRTPSSSDASKSNLPGTVSQHVNAVGSIAVLTAYLLAQKQTDVVGVLAMAFCVLMFGSPLAATKLVLQTQSSAHIPWPFTMASFTNCALWSICGIFDMKDVAVILPNVLGFTLSTMQVLLKWIFPGNPSKDRGKSVESPVVPPL